MRGYIIGVLVAIGVSVVGVTHPKQALANDANAVKTLTITALDDGWAVVRINLSKGSGGCWATNNDTYAFRVDTDAGKAMLNTFMASKISGYRVYVSGTNTCGSVNGSSYELVKYVRVETST